MKKTFAVMLLISTLVTTSVFAYGTDTPNLVGEEATDIIQEEEAKYLKELSLEQAIEEAIKNSPQVKAADLEIKVKELDLRQAKRQENKYKDSGFSMGTVQGFQLDANMYSTVAGFALEEEILRKEYTIEDIKHNVISTYYKVLQARDFVNISKRTLENTERNKNIIDQKYELGLASRSDTLMADIALNEGKINLEEAKQNMGMAFRGLKMILNYPLDVEITLTSDFEKQEFTANIDEDIENAYESRFDMIQMNNTYETVKLDFETNSVKYPSNTFIYREKENNILKVENGLKDFKQSIEFDIRNKYEAIKAADNQIQLSKANLEKAREGLRLTEKSYELGMATVQDVKEVIVQLDSVELSVASAISKYNLSILEYNKAINLGTVR